MSGSVGGALNDLDRETDFTDGEAVFFAARLAGVLLVFSLDDFVVMKWSLPGRSRSASLVASFRMFQIDVGARSHFGAITLSLSQHL